MKVALVGYTGFVGSNLSLSCEFEGKYNRDNIKSAYGTNPDLLVYSGVPAQKFLANSNPEKDYKIIEEAIHNIEMIKPKKLVLISTIDVYKDSTGYDETMEIIGQDLEAYGKNRLALENWVKNNFDDYLILHLPALYGKNLKKNFLYDLIHVIPSMIKESKFLEITESDKFLNDYYTKEDNGFYKCRPLSLNEEKELKKYFESIGFTALTFTDSRASYQFYNLKYLWTHIEIALKNEIKVLNLATEPITSAEIYSYIKGKEFVNEITSTPAKYDFRTTYDTVFGGKNGYIFNKDFILEDIKNFVEEWENA